MWLCFWKKKKSERNKQTRKCPQQQTHHNSCNISSRWKGKELSVWSGAERQRQTWLSVSPFIHQHLKRGTKKLVLSVGAVLSILSPQWCTKIQKSTVCVWVGFCKLQRGLVLKRGSYFFTLYRSIYYFLVASETKCLLYRIRGVGDGKKQLKIRESETNKKK